MANSFISINENGFWAYDNLIEGMQLLLIEEMSNSEYEIFDWVNEYRIQLTIQSLPIIFGGMSMEFDKYLIDKERREIVLFAIDSITKELKNPETLLTEKQMFQLREKAVHELANSEKGNFKNAKDIQETIRSSYWKENSKNLLNKDYYIQGLNMLAKLLKGKIGEIDKYELLNK